MDCLSALASAVSISPSKLPSLDTEPSPPSKAKRKSRAGSNCASPGRSSSETFYSSMDDPGVAQLIASLRDGRASRTAWPGNASAPPTSDGSGKTSPESWESARPPFFLARTSPTCSATPIAMLRANGWMTTQKNLWAEWERFSGIWPRWGWMSGGAVFELPAWAPRIDALEYSSSPGDLWLTPKAPNGGCKLDRKYVASKGATPTGKRQVALENQVEFWEAHCLLPVPPADAGLTFSERIRRLRLLYRRLKCILPSPYNKGRSLLRRRPNPNFIDWLQGLPIGFTSETFDASAAEIWLARCRRRLFLLCSQEGRDF